MNISKELKIGIFVVSVIIASFFLLNYLRGEDLFNREIELSSRFENVEGLVASAPVYIKGYKAGKVAEVEYDSTTGCFNVVCSIEKDFLIPSDSYMTIYSVDIMGGKGVKIDLGTSDVAARDGDTLAPAFEAGLMDGLAGGVGPLLEKVTATLDSLEVTVSGINRLLSEDNRMSIQRTLAHLEKTIASVGSVAAGIEGKSDEIDGFIDNLACVSDKLASISGKADTTMTDISSIVSTISESDIQELVSSFKTLLENINDPEGTIGKLLTDDSAYNSIDELLKDIDSLVRKIEANHKKYIRISVF